MNNLQLTLDSQNQDIDFTPWFEKKFSNPKATINLATLFSGVCQNLLKSFRNYKKFDNHYNLV